MKILMSAYACEPDKGSEPAVGWNWALQAARSHEVWVLTRANNREAIERSGIVNDVPNLHFVYHDLPAWVQGLKRKTGRLRPYYLLWQLTALPKARRLHREVTFDVGHHVTFVSARYPSFLSCMAVPYVWGPVAGGDRASLRFSRSLGLRGTLTEIVRTTSNIVARWDPSVRLTAMRAQSILIATPASIDLLPRTARAKANVVPAIGLSGILVNARTRNHEPEQLHLLYVGNLLYWKGLQFALPAIAMARQTGANVRLTIVGDGPERPALERLADRLDISDAITFKGKLPRDEVLSLYSDYDALIFPSIRDSGGMAVLEAMAAGLPVICLAIGGPSLAVTDATGIRVAANEPDQVVRDMAAAIKRLAGDPAGRERMGEAGRRRVIEDYGWDRLGGLLRSLYPKAAAR